jgi:Ca2+-binding RTX toxin-like protein
LATLGGTAGDDLLQGGAVPDWLSGGIGADTLLSGAGADTLAGGAGADLFVLQGIAGVDSGLGAPDRILDFNFAEGDRLALRAQPVGAALWPIASGSWGLPGQPTLPLGWGGRLAPVAALAAGLALPDPTGGLGFLLRWLPDAAGGGSLVSESGGGGWLVLDADRDGLLGAADLVVRFETAIGQEAFLPGSVAMLGTTAADSLAGTGAADRLHGFAGDDTLAGLDANDTLAGGAGHDSLAGGAGFDSLDGGDGNDWLDGGAGPDALVGGAGHDTLLGGAGDDLLQGGAGHDSLSGGDGNDSLEGGLGIDILQGGAGADGYLLQAMGEAAWSTQAGMDLLLGFSRAEGDRLRISDALADVDAGTYAGADGIARALLWGGVTRPLASLPLGTLLPAQPTGATGATQVFWVPALAGGWQPAGGWLVLDLDRNGRLDATDAVWRIGSSSQPLAIGPEDFTAGTFLSVLRPGVQRGGTADNDTLVGGSGTEAFQGSAGSDRIDGGAGAGNALSYAALSGSVALKLTAYGTGTAAKSAGGTDAFSAIQSFTGTAGADRLDAAAAGTGLFTTSLEGRAGNDTLIGGFGPGVQASYAASPAAARIDLTAGTARDGWDGTDTLVAIRRVAVTSGFADTVLGSAGDDVFLSGAAGDKAFDGRAGTDEWRYAGSGAVVIDLAAGTVTKPGGTDRLTAIEAVVGGAGDDGLRGSATNDRLAGAAGNDTIDGGAGQDIVAYDAIAGGSDLPLQGAVVDLSAGVATDPWGGRDTLLNVESAWGSRLADDLTGRALPGIVTFLRGLAGDDTLRGPAAGSLVMADYAGDPAGVVVDLAAGTAQDGWGGTDRLLLIDRARGNALADRLSGNGNANLLQGGAGDDTLSGAGGNDTLQPGLGADALLGGAGDDQFMPDADARFSGGILLDLGDGTQRGLAFADVAVFADSLDGGTGLDRWIAPAGANLLDLRARPPVGVERFEGGAGADALLLPSGLAAAATLLGAGGNDTLSGGAAGDVLEGQDGRDLLVGQGGNDTLRGGAGDDTLLGGAGHDAMDGHAGRDSLAGGAGNDTLISTDWGVLLDGGAGEDFASVSRAGATRALRLDRDGTGYLLSDGVNTTRLQGIERESVIGGSADDWLQATAGADTLRGGEGADTLSGAGGNDLLEGGAGFDVAALAGLRAGTALTQQSDGSWLAVGPDGTDRLVGIELVRFSDRDVLLI